MAARSAFSAVTDNARRSTVALPSQGSDTAMTTAMGTTMLLSHISANPATTCTTKRMSRMSSELVYQTRLWISEINTLINADQHARAVTAK